MQIPKHQYSRYLISVPFDNGFLPDTLEAQIDYCKNFLFDLGRLARKNGHRLFATYSVCSGNIAPHAHFTVSWLPTVGIATKGDKDKDLIISRIETQELLEENFFYVDNAAEAIKPITHDKKFVTEYVIYQPKDGQSALFSEFYIHPDFVPVYSEVKIGSYCTTHEIPSFQNTPTKSTISRSFILHLVIIAAFILISGIALSLF